MWQVRLVFKVIGVIGSLTMVACAAHQIKVVTYPDNATVVMGDHHCQSPCELPVNRELTYVTASLPDGRSKKVEIPESIAKPQPLSDRLLFQIGDISYLGGLAFAVMGFAAVELFFSNLEDTSRDHELTGEIGLFSIVALVTSYALLKLGNNIGNRERPDYQLEIDFGKTTTSP